MATPPPVLPPYPVRADGQAVFSEEAENWNAAMKDDVVPYFYTAASEAEAASVNAELASEIANPFPTYAEAADLDLTDGMRLSVLSTDTGQHASVPGDVGADGGQTPNSGVFVYSSAESALVRVGDLDSTLSAASATAAEGFKDLAEAAAGVAEVFAGPVFADTTEGLGLTTSGDLFAVNNSGIVTVYFNDAGVAVPQRTLATTAALASPTPGQGRDLIGVPTVAQLLASTAASRGTDKVWNAGQYSYREATGAATDYDAITAGGVKLYAESTFLGTPIDAIWHSGDMTATLTRVMARASASSPMRLIFKPGLKVQIDGILHVPPYVFLDLGEPGKGASFNLGANGQIRQDGRSFIRAEIFALDPAFVGPAYLFDAVLNTLQPSTGGYSTGFDLAIWGNRQVNGRSLVMRSASVDKGFAWVKGRADVREFITGPELEISNGGYINSCEFDFRIFAAKQFYTETRAAGATGEIDSNLVTITVQPDSTGKAEKGVYIDGTKTIYYVKIWDWAGSNVSPNVQIPIICSAKSLYNVVNGNGSTGAFDRPAAIDLSGKNELRINAGRNVVNSMLPRPNVVGQASGEDNDMLAHAASRYAVTFSGDAVNSYTEYQMFTNVGGGTRWGTLTSASVVIDLGVTYSNADVSGIMLQFYPGLLPSSAVVEVSVDNATWTPVLTLNAASGGVPPITTRTDTLGLSGIASLRYIRLSMTGTNSDVIVRRLSLFANDFSVVRQGAYMPSSDPTTWGSLDIKSRNANGYYTRNAALLMNGVQVLSSQKAAVADATDAASVITQLNALLARLRTHGLIAP